MSVEDSWFEMSKESVNCLPGITKITGKRRHPRQKEKNPNILPAKCGICTNAAVGYHYDVASCNGCKAFFRRTIISGRHPKCASRNQCLQDLAVIDKSRKLCAGCRFQKCVDLGMNPMSIQEELVSKEGKAMQRKILRRRHGANLQIVESHSRDELDSVIQQLSSAEDQLRESFTLNLNQLEELDWESFTDILMCPSFSEIKPSSADLCSRRHRDSEVFSLHRNLTSFIEDFKLLDFFPCIFTESASKLIEQNALTCRNMTMSFYSKNTFSWNNEGVGHAKYIKKTMHLFSRNSVDRVEYMLLKVIVLCNPASLELSDDRILIEQERYRYAKHLLHYCLKLYGTLNGPNRYASLLSMLTVLEGLQYEQKCYHLLLQAFKQDYVL